MRPRTNRHNAIKVGFKIMPTQNDKLEILANRLLMSKSEALEWCINNSTIIMPLQTYRCNCGNLYQSKDEHLSCNNCRAKLARH